MDPLTDTGNDVFAPGGQAKSLTDTGEWEKLANGHGQRENGVSGNGKRETVLSGHGSRETAF